MGGRGGGSYYHFYIFPSVSDPDSLSSDPDPIRIQGSMTKNWKKFTPEDKLIFFGSKIAIYLSLGLQKVRSSYRRSLQP
jgi:hypothetical protein